MVGRQGAEVVRRLLPAPLSELLRAHLRALYPVATSDEQRLTVTVQFVVSAFLGLLTWWLDEDVPMPADDIHEIFRQLAAEGVGSFLAT